MSVTRLKRKHRKNIARANNEVRKIKNLLRTPVLKNVDLDELKSKFGQPEGIIEKVSEAAATAATSVSKAATTTVDAVTEAATAATDKVKEAATAATDKVKEAATAVADAGTNALSNAQEAVAGAAEAVTGSSLFERVKHAASDALEAVTHNSFVEKATDAVQDVAHNLVEGAKHVLESKSPEENQATEANQTGTTGFDTAEAETKPVTEESQAGEHPKPEIAL